MQSRAATVAKYLAELDAPRRTEVETVRRVILRNLPKGYEEGMQYGMIGYYVPHSHYPPGYHCNPSEPLPFASLAAQKNYIAFYGMGLYADAARARRFAAAWKKTGKKLDMGKCCVRFKTAADAALDVIGDAVAGMPPKEYIALYERGLKTGGRGKKQTPNAKRKISNAN